MTEFRLGQGAVLPRHAHPHEQTGYLVKGRIRLSIGAETCEVHAGDSWCISQQMRSPRCSRRRRRRGRRSGFATR
ncbi:MAG TPA: cupin domain-containing protein [Verrucomicrobiota bacterium]|nr:cupin domain-containing protein [Verrucomicrobiota bacterium]